VATDADAPWEPPTPDTVERAIEHSALRDWVWTALERLSEPLRLVTILRYFTCADSYEAIAELCGVPIGTVRSRLNAAKANLAEELLNTAAQQHVHPGGLHDRRGLQIAEAMSAFGRDGDQRALAEAFAPDLGFVMFDRVERSGLDNFAAALTNDYDDGLTVRPIRMVTSSDITVLEAWLDSPPENPLHCPPALTQICHHPNGPTRRLVSHYAPREPRPAPTVTQPQPGCR
jgi:Sigma-70, region 4